MEQAQDLDLKVAVDRLCHSLSAHSLRPLAIARNENASCDVAIAGHTRRLLIARVVSHSSEEDYAALTAMLVQGDFDSAILVYCDQDRPAPSSEIAAWSIGDVDLLATLLGRGRCRS